MDDAPETPKDPEAWVASLYEAVELTPEPAWRPPERVRLRRLDVLVLLFILAATGLVYFARLSEPGLGPVNDDIRKECMAHPPLDGADCHKMIPLDEVHYVPDARDVVLYGTESDKRVGSEDGAYVVHPPVGKWFIAAGIKIFGDRPFGWRFFGAVFGVTGVLLIYLIALRLWRSPWWAAFAAAMLALDGLWFVQSRIAMLDIYAAVFFLAGVWLLLRDRDRPEGESRVWLWFGGGALGLALASKLEIVWMFILLTAIVFAWDRERNANEARAAGRLRGVDLVTRAFRWAVAMFVLPGVVYVATFMPWFLDSHRYNPPLCEGRHDVPLLGFGGRFGQWVCYQRQVLDFHRDLAKYEKGKPAHPYFTNGYTWPWVGRPVAHYYEATDAGKPNERRIEVLGLPNLAIWVPGFFVAFPLLAWWAFRRRDATARFLFAMFLAGFAPNALFDLVRRPVFLFYATPLVPFIVLSVTHVWWGASRKWRNAHMLVPGYLVTVALLFAYFYPMMSAWPLSAGGFFGWQGRIWENWDCTVDTIKRVCWI